MISQKSIQDVLDTVRVEDVVGEYVSLRRRGVNLIGLCPFHNEKSPSFNVSPTKNIYKCFGCGKGGNAVQFLMEHAQFTFPEAIRHLAQKYNIELEETVTSQEAIFEKQLADSLYIVNEYAKVFYQQQMLQTDRGKSVGLSYFKQRGFKTETIEKFGLGYASEKRDAFVLKAVNDGYSVELLRKLGLVSQYDNDFFRDRVMFPIHNQSGKVVAFAGRILQKDVKAPKYINSPETEIYNKSKTLYGAFFAKKAIQQQDECILVEGYTDVISLHQGGIENVVASSGTSLTVDQIRLIKRYTPNIKILYDGDFAGIKAALRGLDLVLEQDLNVRVVLLPEDEDPDSYLEKSGSEEFKKYIADKAQDLVLFTAENLVKDAGNDPVKRVKLIKDLASTIGKIPHQDKREIYARECARITKVELSTILEEIKKVVVQRFKKFQNEKNLAGQAVEDIDIKQQEADELSDGVRREENIIASLSDEFQEKDIVRILIAAGGEIYDAEHNMTVAEYIIMNIEDVIEEFDSRLYQKVIKETLHLLTEKLPVSPQYFIHHTDSAINQLAVNLLTSPFDYSENWEKKHDIYLTQKEPEHNFDKDSLQSLLRFKLRKIMRMCDRNMLEIETLGKLEDAEQLMAHLKVQQKLNGMRNDIAKQLGTVVLK